MYLDLCDNRVMQAHVEWVPNIYIGTFEVHGASVSCEDVANAALDSTDK